MSNHNPPTDPPVQGSPQPGPDPRENTGQPSSAQFSQQPPPAQYSQPAPAQHSPPPPAQYSQQPPPAPGAEPYAQAPYPQNPMADGQAGSGIGQPADLMPRFLARLIDYVILAVVIFVLVFVLIVGTLMGAGTGPFGGTGLSSVISAVLGAVIYLAYFALMESSKGQTVGKMAMKLQTRGAAGGNPTMEEALKRNAWTALGILGIIPLLGPVLAFLAQTAAIIYIAVTINQNTATHQGWHDRFAGGTVVVKTG